MDYNTRLLVIIAKILGGLHPGLLDAKDWKLIYHIESLYK